MAETENKKESSENVIIAVQGCCHGELEQIYDTLTYIEQSKGIKIDILLCCGDFQAVRNQVDLNSMAVPPKYRKMGIFSQYYLGVKTAPVLTIFVGGNHEAANHLWELPFGGWVAQNIYYLGYAGVVEFAGLKIGGISGIYKDRDYYKGHFEMPAFNESTKRSFYHTRNYEVFKLKALKEHVDIFMSHDWPRNIYEHGNVNNLLNKKSYFRKEIEDKSLGSPALKELLDVLKPSYWFAAHLHVKFSAIVKHEEKESSDKKEITKFLALDKCLPHRDFLQVIDMGPARASKELRYSKEWLTITKLAYPVYNPTARATLLPEDEAEFEKYRASDEAMLETSKAFQDNLKVPLNFCTTESPQKKTGNMNKQTTDLCQKLGIDNPCAINIIRKTERYGKAEQHGQETSDEIDSSSSDDFSEIPKLTSDPSEISLDETSGDDNDDDNDDETSELSSSSCTKSSGLESHNELHLDTKRKHSSEELSDDSRCIPKPSFLVRRNKALYASLDDDNSESSSSDCL